LDEKEAETNSQEVLNLVKENGSEVEIEKIGKNRLAYPIKQIRYGYFYTIVFNAETPGLKALQEKLVLKRDLLRGVISEFKTKLSNNQKIVYSTDSSGVTIMATPKEEKKFVPSEEVVVPVKEEVKEEKMELKDIDQKLDDILNGDIIPKI